MSNALTALTILHSAFRKKQKTHAKTVASSYDMEGRAQKCVERYCELASKMTEQLYKVSSPCLDHHNFKEEELESIGELSEVVNKLARAVTKWTKACD